jgi:hypothetical protein
MATPHPRVHQRVSESNPALVRVLVHAPSPTRARWIEDELAHRSIVVQIGFSIPHVLSALVDDPPPRPQLLVADFDELEPGAMMDLHRLRVQGWFGRIIALGDVPGSLRDSLAIERVIAAPFTRDSLRHVIIAQPSSSASATIKLPVLEAD